MVAIRSYSLLSPVGAHGVCSSPGLSLLVIAIVIPSLLVTAAVCGLLYFFVRSLRRGQIVLSAVTLIAVLIPFLLFAHRFVEADAADHEHTNCLAGLAKTGPVAKYPDVLVVRTFLWPHPTAARLMVGGSFREVDVIGNVTSSGREHPTETFTIAPTAGCGEELEAWAASGASFDNFIASRLQQCLKITKWDRTSAPERSSAVILLEGRYATSQGCKGRFPRELRIKDGGGDVLVDYLDEPYAEWPIFPLFVSWKGFETRPAKFKHLSDADFVLRNLKTPAQPASGR